MSRLLPILVLIFLFSCDRPVVFGVVKNETKRNVTLVLSSRPVGDSDILRGRVRAFYIKPMGSARVFWGFGLPHVPLDRLWFFSYYDGDTLLYCIHNHLTKGMLNRAFLKEDTITQAELIEKNVRLYYEGK